MDASALLTRFSKTAEDAAKLPPLAAAAAAPTPQLSFSSNASLSQEELKEMKEKNPVGFLKMMMGSRSISVEKSPSSSAVSGIEPSYDYVDALFRQLKAKIRW